MATSRDTHVWTNHSVQQMEIEAYKEDSLKGVPEAWKALFEGEPVRNLMDFGCGTGLWRGALRIPGSKYFGVDQNPEMIQGALKRWDGDDATFTLCPGISDGEKLPFDDGWFDVIFTAAVLQHNIDGDKAGILREFRRTLAKGGRLTMFENTWADNAGTDRYSHDNAGWCDLIEPFGFAHEVVVRDFYVFRAV